MFEFILNEKLSKEEVDQLEDPIERLLNVFGYYSDKKVYKDNKESLEGLRDIIGGLDYHFKNHSVYERNINPEEKVDENIYCNTPDGKYFVYESFNKEKKKIGTFISIDGFILYGDASHEAIAYLNRLGQIFCLFKSGWFVKCFVKERFSSIIPSISALMPIRDKYGAHRQQDMPRPNDDANNLGLSKIGLVPLLYLDKNLREIKICYLFPTRKRELPPNYPSVAGIEILTKDINEDNHIRFIPTECHKVIINEIFKMLDEFFLVVL